MEAKLVVVGGDAKAAEIQLKLPTIIGRGRGASLTLPHPLVSRQHCEIFEANGQLMVRDLGSLNGTFVNNERVTEAVLPSGELLTIGTVTFRAAYEAHADIMPPSGDPKATLQDPKYAVAEDDLDFMDVEEVEDDEFEDEDDEFEEVEVVDPADSIDDLEDSISDLLMDSEEEVEIVHEEETETLTEPRAASKTDDDDLNSFLQGLQ
ncbi:MAG: putative component of type VI protein secretion system [Pirellulaceae bacterium]|jgi:predicted component of type VI protein secretion system